MLPWSDARHRGLSDELGRRLGGPAPAHLAGSLIGLEHEYLVRRRSDGRRVDFGQLVHRIGPSQRGLDPVNRAAYWLPTGAVVTADETEAELALPPTATRPGFGDRLVHRASAAREWLAGRLGPEHYLGEGVSTHLSVAAPDPLLAEACEAHARGWAPVLMLMLDTIDSPGMLVRPRPGRVEMCGEFAVGDDLRASSLFALGSVLACLDQARHPDDPGLPQLRLALRMGDQRYGWYVDRRAAGPDLYVEGRRARLTTVAGQSRTVADHLEQAWSLARPLLSRHSRRADLELVDRLVDGRSALRVERAADRTMMDTGDGMPMSATPVGDGSAYGRALGPRRRPTFALAPVMLTWQLAVFVIAAEDTGRRAFAAVPGRILRRFLRRLDGGLLDQSIAAYLRLAPRRRVLDDPGQVDRVGLFDAISIRPALLPAERPVADPGAAA